MLYVLDIVFFVFILVILNAHKKMFNNQDKLITNKANKAVKACLFGKIAKDTLSFLQEKYPNLSQQGQVHVNKLLKIADKSNEKMMEHFCKSADSISKETCMSYSKGQLNLILQAMKNKEDVTEIKCISPYVYNEDLLQFYKTFNMLTDSNGEYTLFSFRYALDSDMILFQLISPFILSNYRGN